MTITSRSSQAALGLAVLAVLATSACGGQSLDNQSGGSATKSQGAFTPEPAPKEEAAKAAIDAVKTNASLGANLPQAIRDKGLQMTTSEGYPPMEMFASDGKTLLGVDPAIGRAIANKLGVKVTMSNQDFNSQIPGVTTGRFDIIMSSMTDSAKRRETVSFVDYVKAGNGWVVKAGNPAGIAGPETVCGKTVSVVDNGSSLTLAKQFDDKCKQSGKPAINIITFPGDQEALLQVRNGRADANLNDYPVAAYRAKVSEGALQGLAIDGEKSTWGIAMKKDAKELQDATQKALQELITDGTYGQILKAYGVEDMALQKVTINDQK